MTNKYLTEQNKTTFQRFSFWSKFVAVLGFIGAAFMILAGLPLLLAFGLGLIYIGIGIYYIFMLKHLWAASNTIKELENTKNDEELTEGLLSGVNSLSNYFKLNGILVIVGFVIGIIGGLVAGASLFAAISNGTLDDLDSTTTPSIYDNSDFQDALKELENLENLN